MAIFLRWKKDVLQRWFMCISKERVESVSAPGLVRDVERAAFWPENLMLAMGR